MSFKLKSIPTEISQYIELPDMGELLTYPIFFDTDIDSAYRYGSDFQRKLIEMTPLRGDKKTISVMSEVRLMVPNVRCCTMPSEDYVNEWHIDCEENEDGPHIYHEERDIVHLLSNNVDCTTEFLKYDVTMDNFTPNYHNYMDFINHFREKVRSGELDITPIAMPSNKIVTFTNHIHRATQPKKIQLRYMFRIVETDRKRPASPYNPEYATRVINLNGDFVETIKQENDAIKIYVPQSIRNEVNYKGENELKTNKTFYKKSSNKTSNKSTYQKMTISELSFNREIIDYNLNPDFYNFIPRNSIMLVNTVDNFDEQENNKNLHVFLENVDRSVKILDSKNNVVIETETELGYYNIDKYNRKISGSVIKLSDEQLKLLNKNEEYHLEFNENSPYSFKISSNITFTIE